MPDARVQYALHCGVSSVEVSSCGNTFFETGAFLTVLLGDNFRRGDNLPAAGRRGR
jgi:hypothetical protein